MCRQRAGCNAGTEGLVEAEGQELGGSCRKGCAAKGQAATLEPQRLTAKGLGGSWGLNAPTTERYVQAKGRLPECWNSKSWRPEGLVEAAARELEGFKRWGFKRLKPGKRQAWMPQQERAMCRQMQQRLTARGLGGSCREGIGGF